MGERSQYTPGTFCWSELSTTDQDAAKAFYGALFGWSAVDFPMGESDVYSMMQVDGHDVAAIAKQPQQQAAAGVPSLWNSYVSVLSADATAERAKELGAAVHAPPFDVMEAGRMAVIQDPQGAYFMLWEPRGHFGAALVNAPGALVWNELPSPTWTRRRPSTASCSAGRYSRSRACRNAIWGSGTPVAPTAGSAS